MLKQIVLLYEKTLKKNMENEVQGKYSKNDHDTSHEQFTVIDKKSSSDILTVSRSPKLLELLAYTCNVAVQSNSLHNGFHIYHK